MSIKYYLIDTNVLLHDPTSIFAFADNKVIITQYVLEELDHHKTGNADIDTNRRCCVGFCFFNFPFSLN